MSPVPWLIAALIGTLFGGLALHGAGYKVLAFILFTCAIGFGVAIGRVRESRRAAAWDDCARWVGGSYRGPQPGEFLQRFGDAPWQAWPKAYNMQCTRLIDGPGKAAAFSLLNVRFSESSTGETDADYEVTIAVLPVESDPPHSSTVVPTDDKHHAVHNGRFLFVWRRAFAAVGRELRTDEIPALLDEARAVARDFKQQPSLPQSERAAAPPGRSIPLLVALGWAAVIGAAFMPRYSQLVVALIALGWVLAAIGLDWRRVSGASHWAFLVGCGIAVWGANRGNALMLYGIPIGLSGVLVIQAFATSKTTRRDERGRLTWRRAGEP